jgi:hypothetical protein
MACGKSPIKTTYYMPRIVKPDTVKVVTKDGECHVAIDLTININTTGGGVSVVEEEKTEEKPAWQMPNFAPTQKIKFGKNVS